MYKFVAGPLFLKLPTIWFRKMNQVDNRMVLLSQYCTSLNPQLPPEGEARPRRRRKKAKGEAEEVGGSGTKKRQLSAEQVKFLEMNFGSEHKLQSERKARLASEIGLDPRQVAVWFQNRRARWKSKQLEEDYERVKSLYDAVSIEKCRLEIEVMELKRNSQKLRAR